MNGAQHVEVRPFSPRDAAELVLEPAGFRGSVPREAVAGEWGVADLRRDSGLGLVSAVTFMCMRCVHVPCGCQRVTWERVLFTMWILGIEPRLSGLAASTLPSEPSFRDACHFFYLNRCNIDQLQTFSFALARGSGTLGLVGLPGVPRSISAPSQHCRFSLFPVHCFGSCVIVAHRWLAWGTPECRAPGTVWAWRCWGR